MAARMFTMRMGESIEKLDLMCCIPVHDDFAGEERVEFADTPALCVYHRGPYEELGTAILSLYEHVQKNNIATTGPFRCIYLEGPPNRGDQSSDYITQIAVPIRCENYKVY